jgi:hypothetical protein
MDINTSLAGQLFVLVLLTNLAVVFATWAESRNKAESPRLLTVCNAILGFFPPLNILVLARLAMLGKKMDSPVDG